MELDGTGLGRGGTWEVWRSRRRRKETGKGEEAERGENEGTLEMLEKLEISTGDVVPTC